MEYLHFDYGYISEQGQFFIPRAMQDESELQASTELLVTLVKCDVKDGHIILSHYKTVTKDEFREMQQIRKDATQFIDERPFVDYSKFDDSIRHIDEIGRIILPINHRKKLNIEPHDIIVSFMINYTTIKLRLFVNKHSAVSVTA